MRAGREHILLFNLYSFSETERSFFVCVAVAACLGQPSPAQPWPEGGRGWWGSSLSESMQARLLCLSALASQSHWKARCLSGFLTLESLHQGQGWHLWTFVNTSLSACL